MSHHCSILTLLAIGFERYRAICHPLKETTGHHFTSVSVVIPAVWALSIIVSLPFAIISNCKKEKYYDGSLVDVCITDMSSPLARAYIIIISFLCLVLPLVLLTGMYASIIRTLARSSIAGFGGTNGHSAASTSNRNSTTSVNTVGSIGGGGGGLVAGSGRTKQGQDTEMVRHARVMSSRRQVVRMMVAVMTLYFCCLVPLRCVQLWHVFQREGDKARLGFEGYFNLVYCSRILVVLNSAGNPIIYSLLSSNFRSAFKQSLFNCKSNSQHESWRYNTNYYSNSHHHHYLSQHNQGSPAALRLSHLATTSAEPNRQKRQRSLDISLDASSKASGQVKQIKRFSNPTIQEPLLVDSTDLPASQRRHTQTFGNSSGADFV
ncbi:thyrotropin-releasing hormone receptor [Plakobranchus ocellatus]|uniref:Thyrotropin-releasing hormone receptor n=1 Tax=Plakobranchus ocellatus TaxID=259542 RepID=A0AAV4CW97_9GAST|nr:thyrotropin-releasing hormone receptor [Plakobranchus ocellatus]